MNKDKNLVDLKLVDGSVIKMEYSKANLQPFNAQHIVNFQEVFKTIESFAFELKEVVRRTQAKKTTVEFGVELFADDDKLSALVVKGTDTANIKFTFEW